jgi:hypothetical protein
MGKQVELIYFRRAVRLVVHGHVGEGEAGMMAIYRDEHRPDSCQFVSFGRTWNWKLRKVRERC